MGEHLISWKPLRFASWFPTFISCSPNLPHVYIRLCKHTNHFTFLQYLSFSYGSFSWSRVNVYFWFSGVGEKRRWIKNKVVHRTITERKIQNKKVMKSNWSCAAFWFILYRIYKISVYFETDCIRMPWYLLYADIVVACHMTLWHHDMLLWQ